MNLREKLLSFFQDRSNKEISANILLTFLIKGGAMIISVLIVPSYARYFGNDDVYGAWLTVSAVFIWINMFDFGIGNGLRNCLVKSLSDKNDLDSKRYISSAYISVGLLSLAFLVVGYIVIALLDWNVLLKVSTAYVSPTVFKLFMGIIFSGVVIHFFFLLISSVCYALQKTYLPGLVALITQVLLLVFLNIPNAQPMEGKVISLSVAYLLAYNLPILIVTVWIFAKTLRHVRPSLKMFDREAAGQVVGLGGVFFLIQIALIALNSSNEIYINAFYSPSDVVQYNYYHKLFYVLMVAITLILQPIWSAVTKAFYEKKFARIRKMYWVIHAVGGVLCVCAFLLALIYQPLANIWLGEGVLHVEPSTAMAFALFTSIYILSNATNSFSNGLGLLTCQAICAVVGAVIKLVVVLAASWLWGETSWSLVMWANVIAYLPLMIVHPVYLLSKLRKMKE